MGSRRCFYRDLPDLFGRSRNGGFFDDYKRGLDHSWRRVFFSLYIIQMDRVGVEIPIRVSVFYQSFVAGFFALVSVIGLHFTGIEEAKINPNMRLIPGVLYNALLASVLTTFLQTKFQHYVSPTRVGIIFSLEPVFSSIIAFLLLGETSGPIRIAGCTIVFGGLLLAELIGKDLESGS